MSAGRGAGLAWIFAVAACGTAGCAGAEEDRSSAPAQWSPSAPPDAEPRSADGGSSRGNDDRRDARSSDEAAAASGAAPSEGEENTADPAPAPSVPTSGTDGSGGPVLPDGSVLTFDTGAAVHADGDGGSELDVSAVRDALGGPAAVDAFAINSEARAVEPADAGSWRDREVQNVPDASASDDASADASDGSRSPGEVDVGVGEVVAPPDAIVINEVESSGGVPGDWVELFNAGSTTVDLAGWTLKDSDDSHAYVVPLAQVDARVEPGGYFVLDESTFEFGLGAADSARLFDQEGRLVAAISWTVHAATTYGRCLGHETDGATTLVPTKGGPNACGVPGEGPLEASAGEADLQLPAGVPVLPWPGGPEVTAVDAPGAYAGNLSGLAYQPASAGSPDTIWAVQNDPSLLYALQASAGESWLPRPADGPDAAQALRYPDGSGAPDAEGVTVAEWDASAVYVAAERDNLQATVSRLSVLRYDVRSRAAELVATHEWNLTADLPVSAANVGLEGITWVPDDDLTALAFHDERTSARYAPAVYPNHGTGLFFVGLESNGMIYAYALDHQNGAAYRVGTMTSGQRAVMDLAFDRELHQLWAYCDNTCSNRATVLALAQGPGGDSVQFLVRGAFERPSALGDFNNEGIALAPERACQAGLKPFFWSDDSATEGHALRRGTIACRALP